jgi:hypothetical protein
LVEPLLAILKTLFVITASNLVCHFAVGLESLYSSKNPV